MYFSTIHNQGYYTWLPNWSSVTMLIFHLETENTRFCVWVYQYTWLYKITVEVPSEIKSTLTASMERHILLLDHGEQQVYYKLTPYSAITSYMYQISLSNSLTHSHKQTKEEKVHLLFSEFLHLMFPRPHKVFKKPTWISKLVFSPFSLPPYNTI